MSSGMSNFDSLEPSPAAINRESDQINELESARFGYNDHHPLRVKQSGSEADGSNEYISDKGMIEVRAVQTIEEFFRPQLDQQNNKTFTSKMMITESDNDDKSYAFPGTESLQENYTTEQPKLKLGFPNMKYMDPSIQGPPV